MGKTEQRLRKARASEKQERRDKRAGDKIGCERCRQLFFRRELTQFNPFNEEVYNEKIPCRLCEECAWEASRDV